MRSNPIAPFLTFFAFLTAAIFLCPTGALASERTPGTSPALTLANAPVGCATFVNCKTITVQLDAAGQASISATELFDGSDVSCGIKDTSLSKTAFGCSDIGANSVVLTLTDSLDGMVTCTTTVTVQDMIAPTLSCSGNISVSTAPGSCDVSVSFPAPTATDNCGGSPAPTSLFGYTYLGTHNGHTYFISNVIRKGDDAIVGADTLSGLNGYFVTINDAAENAFLTGTITDQALIGLNDKVTEGTFLWENGEPFSYNNWGTNEPNDFGTNGEDYVTLQTTGTWNDVFTSSNPSKQYKFIVELEPTGAAISVTQTAGPASGSSFAVGTTTITYEAMDAEGNTSQCSFDIIVNDNENPVAVCQDMSVSLDGSGNASITAASVDGSSTDNCGTPAVSIDLTSFDCNDIGANTVVLTATDGNGNTDTCHATVTVVDDEVPTMTCPADILAYINANECYATVSGTDPGAADNCAVNLTYSISGATSGSGSGSVDGLPFNLGESTVTYSLNDGNGNSHAGCSFTITVMPTDDAVSCASCPSGPAYDTNLPDPVVIGSGLSDQHFAVSQYCGLNVGLRAHRRFLGDIVPSPGDTYSIETGESPTSGSDPTPASGVAKWNYLASINLGTYTFNDLYVYLKLDFDASDSANQVGPYVADISQFMIDNSQGNTSFFQSSENLGFAFWQSIGDPAILPFDPFATGTYDLSVEVLSPDSVLILQSAIEVSVFKPGCTDPFSTNYDPTATQDDASCTPCAPASLAYNTTYPNPIVIGSGLNGQNMAVANYCGIDAGLRAHKRFLGYVTPVNGNVPEDTYQFGTGVSPTSGSSGVPDTGKARWDLFFAVDLGNFTFNDVDVLLDVDFDPSDGGAQNPPVTVDLSQVMIDTGLGNTSILQASENLGFNYWLAFAHPNMPFDPYAEGIYDLTLRVVAPGNVEVINIPIRVEVGCEFVVPSENLEPATLTCPADITINNQMVIDPWLTGWATLSGGCSGDMTYGDDRTGLDQCNMTGTLVRTFYNSDSSNTCTQNITIVDTTGPWLASCPANITVSTIDPSCVATASFTSPQAHELIYKEGFEDPAFESGNPTNVPFQGWNDYNSVLTRVSSGTRGITSKDGSAHGELSSVDPSISYTGAFSRLGGYSTTFGDGFSVKNDVYIDLADPAVTANTYGWDLSAAANRQTNAHRRDFIFHAASNATGNVLIGGSNNSNFAPRADLASLNHYEITTSGWFTFEWVFRDSAGSLAVDLNLYDAAGTFLWQETRYTVADLIATEVGGNRYLWFTFLATDYLAIDNTQLTRTLPVSCTANSGDLFAVGTTSVTCTALDSCGNSAECSFNINVEDNNAPTAVCKDTSLYLDANGSASLTAEDLDNGSTDNCNGLLTFSASKTSFDCTDVGNNTVILTVSDGSNTDTCWSTVTVVDTVKPTVSVSNITVQLDASGSASITANSVVSGSSDACGVASISASPLSFGCADIGPNKVAITVIDNNGNTTHDTATVTVEDNVAPTAVCLNITVQLDASGNASITAAQLDAASFDNCVIDSIWAQPNSFTCADIGTPKTVAFTVRDKSGNQNTCNALVTVADDNNPCAPTCVPLQIVALNLVTAGPGGFIAPLSNGYVINKAAINGNFSVEALHCSGPLGSVVFTVNGNVFQKENIAPYAIKGDNPPGNFNPWKPAAGLYTITATPYTSSNGNGTAGVALTVNIEVVESGPAIDCNNDINGTAYINSCGICVEGATGLPANSGQDDCGTCGGNNADKDCAGVCFGSAALDACGDCAGGTTGITPNSGCNVDCNGDVNGTATLDSCGVCTGGNTGLIANADKDTCGVCFGNNLSCAPCQPFDVIELTLVDVSSGSDIGPLSNGYVINKSLVAPFAVRAEVCQTPVGSVIFRLNGSVIQTENVAPYAISGDNASGYNSWNPQAGTYTLSATGYSGANGKGTVGGTTSYVITIVDSAPIADCNGVLSGTFTNECGNCVGGNTGNPIDFGKDDCGICNGNNEAKDCNGDCFGTAVVDSCGQCVLGNTGLSFNNSCNIDCAGILNGSATLDDCGICSGGTTGLTANTDKDTCGVCFGDNLSCATCVPLQVVSLTLVDLAGNPIATLTNGYVIDKSALPGGFSVRADVCDPPSIGSVRFFLNSSLLQNENTAPYAIKGDNASGYKPWNPSAGVYTIEAIPYSGGNGNGVTGVSEMVTITVIDAPPATDCAGVTGGNAMVDDCGVCAGGTTGLVPNADKDDCGVCNGTNADKDCAGVCFGTASIDFCGDCSGGTTGITPNSGCNIDCNGDLNGTATLDSCGVCTGGNTGLIANADKDTCGVCFGDNTSCATCVPNEVTALVLVSAGSAGDIGPLTNGYVIDKSVTGQFNVRAEVCSGPDVESVVFNLNGINIRTENLAPYAANGDGGGSYNDWPLSAGAYTLIATPYSGNNGGGSAGTALTVNFTVIDAAPVADCAGVLGGSAFIDACSQCVGGTTGQSPCIPPAGCGDFIEQGGLVVVEMESEVAASSNWFLGSGDVSGLGTSGSIGSFYMWKQNCISGTAPNYVYSGCTGTDAGSVGNSITYDIVINTTGRYRFQMRSWQPAINYNNGHGPSTENNDFWLQLPDGGGLKKKGATEVPIGTSEWVKVYQNNTTSWVWATSTVDNNPHEIYVDFATAGTYQIRIAGRSKLMGLDRFVLYHSSLSESTATTALPAESPRGACASVANAGGGNTVNATQADRNGNGNGQPAPPGAHAPAGTDQEVLPGLAMRLFPNPTTGALTVETENAGDDSELMLLDMSGKLLRMVSEAKVSGAHRTYSLNLGDLPKGIYLVKLRSGSEIRTKRVVKE